MKSNKKSYLQTIKTAFQPSFFCFRQNAQKKHSKIVEDFTENVL